MAFRKRNIGIGRTPSSPHDSNTPSPTPTTTSPAPPPSPSAQTPQTPPTQGTRPSPLTGIPTTSTGTPTLDNLLAGHSGLPLGQTLLIGENGTTDYAGALARYFAAEGVVQGHVVHVLGVGEGGGWGRGLPGLVEGDGKGPRGEGGKELMGGEGGVEKKKEREREGERMKIAWRYEGLGQFGEGRRAAVDRTPKSASSQATASETQRFCHTFDLTTRLTHPAVSKIIYHHPTRDAALTPTATPTQGPPTSTTTPTPTSPFTAILTSLHSHLTTTPPSTLHRLLIPTLLNPATYPPHASHPTHLLSFMHALRALTRQFPHRLVVMITLPLSLYPRSSALVRWLEHLADGVLEVTPFPHSTSSSASSDFGGSGVGGSGSGKEEAVPQGLVGVHKLPVFHERGGGAAGAGVGGGGAGAGGGGGGEDLAFTVSRKRFEIRPFSLPPAEGDQEAQEGKREGGGGIEF